MASNTSRGLSYVILFCTRPGRLCAFTEFEFSECLIRAPVAGGYCANNKVATVAIGAREQLMNTALTWLFQMQGQLK